MTEIVIDTPMDLRSEHFLLYRGKNAFGHTLSLTRNAYPAILLHQPYNAWSHQHWIPSHHEDNERVLLRLLEIAYQQGRESIRKEFRQLLMSPGKQ